MSQAHELAARFLRVFDAMAKFAKHQMPDDFVGQLNLKQLLMMHLLFRQPGLSQKEIAEHFQVTPAAISTAVRDLEALELIERLPDPSDARQMNLHLSQKGKAIVYESQEKRKSAILTLLSALPIEEQEALITILERAFERLQEMQISQE